MAIGWHFLFEGLGKIQSHYIGPTETNRPFTSEDVLRTSIDLPSAARKRASSGSTTPLPA